MVYLLVIDSRALLTLAIILATHDLQQEAEGSEPQLPPRLERSLVTLAKLLRETFASLKPVLSDQELEMPEALRLSKECRDLTYRLAEALQKSIQITETSIRDFNQLRMVGSEALNSREIVSTFASEAKERIDCTNGRLCDGSRIVLKELRDELIKFQQSSIQNSKVRINTKLGEQNAEQRRAKDKIVFASNAELPDSGDPFGIMGMLSKVLKHFLKVVTDRVEENVGDKLALIQEKRELYHRERAFVDKLFCDADAAIAFIGDCDSWWLTVKDDMSVAKETLDAVQSQPMQPNTEKILNKYDVVADFVCKVNGVLSETSVMKGLSLTSAIENFEEHIKNIVSALKKLASFSQEIRRLTELLFDYLTKIGAVFLPWSHHARSHLPTESFTFVVEVSDMMHLPPLDATAKPTYERISSVLVSRISRRKSKHAEHQREREDKDGTSETMGRRLATQGEAVDTLCQLHEAMKDISKFVTDLGLALLHFNRRTGCDSTPRGTDATAPERMPKDPFDVPEDTIKRVSDSLMVETSKLKLFATELEELLSDKGHA